MQDVIIQMSQNDRFNLIYWFNGFKAMVSKEDIEDAKIFEQFQNLLNMKLVEGDLDADNCIVILSEINFCGLLGALYRIRNKATVSSWDSVMNIICPSRLPNKDIHKPREMLKLSSYNSELLKIRSDTYISIWNPEVFEGQFSSDRYGKEAALKLKAYAKSLDRVSRDGIVYGVVDHLIMYGSCGYVGSLLLQVEKEK